jgi:ABC-type transport system involved in multi-copper enzyme maturation permease subunit
MKAITKYLIITSIRSKLFYSIFALLGMTIFVSLFIGSTSLIEQKQTSLVFLAGLTRTISILSIIIFICNYISRILENKEIDLILSKDFSRDKIILSYVVAFSFNFLIFITIPFLLILLLGNNPLGAFIWFLSLLFEGLIIIIFAILISVIIKNAIPTTLISISFYFLSRTMGFFASNRTDSISDFSFASLEGIGAFLMKIISTLFPRIDLFTQSSWLTNTPSFAEIQTILLQFVIYFFLMLFMALYDFEKSNF